MDHGNSIAFNLVRTLPNKETDDGDGDLFSQLGEGTELEYNGWDADITWTIRF